MPAGFKFRLIDMFVVITVLGIGGPLVAMWLNHSVHTPTRSGQCNSNQRQLSLALITFENLHGYYPGYTNRVGAHRATWAVQALPYMEEPALYDVWAQMPVQSPRHTPFIGSFVCPADWRGKKANYSSYVGNAGMAGSKGEIIANGMMHDYFPNPKDPALRGLRVRVADIHDGTSHTLLISENLQATTWSDLRPGLEKVATVFVWHPTLKPNAMQRINGGGVKAPLSVNTARPSSLHPGYAIAVYADGHSTNISEKIDYRVYQQLLTTDDANADLPDKANRLTLEELKALDY